MSEMGSAILLGTELLKATQQIRLLEDVKEKEKIR